jgi:3-polyprenyl-4-hydroxybenzoate decarboxylase
MLRRRSPILRQVNTTLFTDHQPLITLPHEALIYERLREHGTTAHDVLFIPWGGTMTCVIKLTPEYDGQAMDALICVFGHAIP